MDFLDRISYEGLQAFDYFSEIGGVRDGQAAGVIFAEIGGRFGDGGGKIFDDGMGGGEIGASGFVGDEDDGHLREISEAGFGE